MRKENEMTYSEFFKVKGLETEEDIKDYLKERKWWSEHFVDNISEYMKIEITNFEVFCDYPFWKLNNVYNSYYLKNNGIGSTYDWLSDTATGETVEKYLGKENE